jgi:hypothetical protein
LLILKQIRTRICYYVADYYADQLMVGQHIINPTKDKSGR